MLFICSKVIASPPLRPVYLTGMLYFTFLSLCPGLHLCFDCWYLNATQVRAAKCPNPNFACSQCLARVVDVWLPLIDATVRSAHAPRHFQLSLRPSNGVTVDYEGFPEDGMPSKKVDLCANSLCQPAKPVCCKARDCVCVCVCAVTSPDIQSTRTIRS